MQYLLKSLIVYNLMDFWKEFIKHVFANSIKFLYCLNDFKICLTIYLM